MIYFKTKDALYYFEGDLEINEYSNEFYLDLCRHRKEEEPITLSCNPSKIYVEEVLYRVTEGLLLASTNSNKITVIDIGNIEKNINKRKERWDNEF